MAKNKWMYKYANSHTIERISSGKKKKKSILTLIYYIMLHFMGDNFFQRHCIF